jgi:hypothetical protein
VTESDGALPHVAISNERTAARSWRVSAAELRAAAVVVVVLAIIGLLVGLVWGHVAPRALYTVVDVKQRLAQQNDVESEAQVGVDGWFALIGAGVGLVTGAVAWRWRSARGPFLMIVIAAASLLSAVIAWRFGLWVGRHPTQSQLQPIFDKVGNTFRPAIKMRAKASLFFQPVGAVIAALISVGFSHDDSRSAVPAGATVDEALAAGYAPVEPAWIGEAWPGEHKQIAGSVWLVRSPWPSLTTEQAIRLVSARIPAENPDAPQEIFTWSDEQARTALEHVPGDFGR